MADSATPLVACSPTGPSRKNLFDKNGAANKVAVLRATIDGSPSLLQYHPAIPKPTQQGHQPRRGILTHSFFSKTCCSIHSSFHIFRNRDEQFVLCHLRHLRHLLGHQASNNRNPSRQVGPRPVHRLPSLVSSSDSTCSHARITKFDDGYVQTQHGVQLPAWTVHVRPQQHWVVEPQSLHHQCLHPQSHFPQA